MRINLMDIKKQHEEHACEYESAAISVLRSGSYIMGENVKLFEKEFAEYIGTQFAIGVGNGTDAIGIALEAIGVGPGDEVITTPFTFVATAEPIVSLGAKPVFVDVDKKTYCIDASKIESAITKNTKVILPVHFYGQCADMDKIMEIAKRHNLFVVEDACQAAGAEYKGQKAGSIGDIGCFSFFPTKTLGCDGDGGMITTNNQRIAEACQAFRVHGSGINGLRTYNNLHPDKEQLDEERDLDKSIPKYYNFIIGRNSRLDEIQAAILRKKLLHLDEFVFLRRKHAKQYSERLANSEYVIPFESPESKHAYYLFVLQHPKMIEICEKLKKDGIGVGTYYPIPLHEQIAFKESGYKKGDFPIAELHLLFLYSLS